MRWLRSRSFLSDAVVKPFIVGNPRPAEKPAPRNRTTSRSILVDDIAYPLWRDMRPPLNSTGLAAPAAASYSPFVPFVFFVVRSLKVPAVALTPARA